MQTTLLGIAIAIILALVTALVGPFFVDWGRYRDTFEAKATRLTGLEVRFAGPIEVHILPIPTVKLQGIEVRRPGELTRTRARALQIEFALDALMRGEFRATNVTVEGPELALGLDKSGRFDWPAPAIGFDPDALSIDHLAVEDGYVALADAASGAQVTLEKLSFSGDVRSLIGPAKGDGSFVIAGQSYPYRISASRPGADGAVKLHLLVDPVDNPRLADLDGSVWIERGIPHFEAMAQWSHGFARSPTGTGEPWRVTGLVRGSSAAAVVEKVEFQYGPEERAVRLHGDAKVTLGQKPELSATLAATQIDLDRILGLPERVRRKPAVALRSLGDRFSGLQRSPIPMRVAISAEALTLAGGALQRLSGEVHGEAGAWTLDSLDFRAPGATQMLLRGHLNITPQGADFAGPARIEARDPRALVSWLTGRSDAQAIAGPFRAEGDVRLGTAAVAIDHLKAELDRTTFEGRFAYTWPSADHPARIEAALSAPEVDFDRAYGLVLDVFAGTSAGAPLEWPKEGTLALNVARSSVAGVTVQGADVNLRFDPQALEIERLAIADFGGASVAAKGNIDISTRPPRGTVTLDLDVHALDGVAALLEKVAPQAAGELRRSGARFVPAKLQGSLAVDEGTARAAGTTAGARFKISGNAGTFALNLQGDAGDASTFTDVAKLGAAKLAVTGRLEAQDGGALIALIGLDRLVAVGNGAGRFDLKATGTVDGPMAVEAQITAEGLDVSTSGSMRLPIGHAATAGLALKLAKANLRTEASGAVPASLTARLDLADDKVALTELRGQVAGADIGGRLAFGLSQPGTLDGDIRLGKADLPALIAATAGMPGKSGDGGSWPAEPFGGGLFAGSTGRIAVASAETRLSPRLAARDLHGAVQVEPSKVTLGDFEGALAGGTISGRVVFQRGPDGLVADGRVQLRNVDMATVSPGDGRPLSGRLTLDATIEGSGRSPVALMGSLRGSGTFSAENTGVARLDPGAFAAVIRSVDNGLPIEPKPVGDRLDAALAGGTLAIPHAQGTFTVAGGAARLVDILRTQGANLALSADVDLGAQSIDATLTLTGPEGLGPADIGRPEITVALQGPVAGPKRTLDVAAFTNWLSLRAVAANAKRLEAAEAARRPASAAPPARTPPQVRPDAQARLEPQVKAEPQAKVEPQIKVEPLAAVAPQARVEPPAKVEPLAKVEPPAAVAPQARVEPPAKVEVPAAVAPQARVEPPPKVEPPARVEPQQQARVEPRAQPEATPPAVAAADPAIQNLDQAIAANPNDATALSKRGQLYVLRGNFPFAIRDFDEVLRLRPKDPEALNNRCWARAILGDLQTALRDCNDALQIRPRYADAYDSRGFVNLKIGQSNSAIADYDAALRINPKQASSLYGRGMAKLKAGNSADATRDIAAAKALQPNIAEEFAGFGIR